MELRYPLVLIIIPILLLYYFFKKKKEVKFKTGSKIANTSYIKNNVYYKRKVKEYKILINILRISCIAAIVFSTLLLSRISKVQKIELNEYKRDIFLCMDVSASVDDLNRELVNNLKNTVTSLKGERFGISIFNSSSVTLVPLTDDYDYVINVLSAIDKSINANLNRNYNNDDFDEYFYNKNYIISGTDEGYETRGSSLIGDGLASCVFAFPKLDEKRTRIIIFSTDNDLAGTPLVSLKEASNISKKKGIKVYSIGTKKMKTDDRSELKKAAENTSGKYYEHSSQTVNNIVNDIEQTSKSLIKNNSKTVQFDIPAIPFILLLISVSTLIIINRKVTK